MRFNIVRFGQESDLVELGSAAAPIPFEGGGGILALMELDVPQTNQY